MLRRAALLLAGVFALVSVLSAPEAQAQTWKKKRPKKAKVDKARSKAKKKKRGANKKRRPVNKAARESDDDEDVLVEEEGDDEEWQDEQDEDDEDGGEDILIDDEYGDVGPDADAGTTTRLEIRAMSFARTGVDMVRDEVPDAETVPGSSPNREDVISYWLHGRAQGVGRYGRRIEFKVAARFDAELSLDSKNNQGTERYEGRVWDTYVDLTTSKLDIRFGNQFVTWGTAELLSPNDVVNARDLRRGFLMHPDERRLPVLALSATLHDGPFRWQVLWVPVAPVNRFELLQGDYALLGPSGATALERKVGAIVSALQDDPRVGTGLRPILDIGEDPDHGVRTGEVGTSIGLQFSKLDLFGYFLYGHERDPRIDLDIGMRNLFLTTPGALTAEAIATRVSELSAMGTAAVRVNYPRRLHVGGAIATRLEPVGFKLDVGYTLDANTMIVPPGAGPLLSLPEDHDWVTTTVSLDYDRGDELMIVVESSYTRVLGVPEDRAVFQMDGDDQLVFGSRFQWSPGEGPLSIRFLGFVDARSDPSYALRPALRLSGQQHWSIELAGVLYGGPATSLGGIQARNDEVQLTLQYDL